MKNSGNRLSDLIGVTRPTAEKLIKAYENGSICVADGKYYVDPSKKVK